MITTSEIIGTRWLYGEQAVFGVVAKLKNNTGQWTACLGVANEAIDDVDLHIAQIADWGAPLKREYAIGFFPYLASEKYIEDGEGDNA